MPISQIPAPSTGGGGDTAFAVAIPVIGTTYQHVNNFAAGIYTISVNPTSSNAFIALVSETTVLVNARTTSGTVGVTLSSAATKAYITLGTGATAGAIVTIAKTAGALTSTDIGNGTLDTINTTGTYNQTGLLSVLVVGGGVAGLRGNIGFAGSGQTGGRAGFINQGFVYTNTSTTVTIGAKGVAQVTNNDAITDANNSSFGNLVTATSASNIFANGNGGIGSAGYNNPPNAGNISSVFGSFNGASTTGGGGGGTGSYSQAFGVGSGSGIGTGGSGGGGGGGENNRRNPTTVANAGTGKGSGGGGGAFTGGENPNAVGKYGGDGSNGVVYVLRGF
jgi:hypothetical protein